MVSSRTLFFSFLLALSLTTFACENLVLKSADSSGPHNNPDTEPFPTGNPLYQSVCAVVQGQNRIRCEIPDGTNTGAWNTMDHPFFLPVGMENAAIEIINRDSTPNRNHTYHFNGMAGCGHGPTPIGLNQAALCDPNGSFEGFTYDHYNGASGDRDIYISTAGAALYIEYCSTCHSSNQAYPFSTSNLRVSSLTSTDIENALNSVPSMMNQATLNRFRGSATSAVNDRGSIANWLSGIAN